ncbi:phasin family protein [Roseovarius arcticus]|uniref:phasin family protein n=1 Tax=Roseovarius arcticus TaxID=2547404 RepID=UPI0014874F37|nr:phasin family protein [Roseovarius arcticus]
MPNDQTPMRKSPEAPTRATQETKNWFDAINPAVNIWAQSNAALLTQMSETAKTVHQFTQARLQANIEACRSLSSCHDPAELAGHQREFMENATAQYSEHAQNISERTVAMITAAAKRPAPDH